LETASVGTDSYDSYNNSRMSFYLTPLPSPDPMVNIVTPISGSLTYTNVKGGGWKCTDDGHSLEGLLVRDAMRVFGGVLDL